MSKLEDKIKGLPQAPGVYIFKDAAGKILYIGKAKSLRKRAQSYFNRPLDAKTQVMVSKVADINYRLAPSESQAEILEAALIKDYQPQYNIDLKDDKSFPLVKITSEQFPVVSVCRRKKPVAGDLALYFGPYTDAKALRQVMKLMRRIFGFRSCKKLPKQACLYWRLGLCPAPCIGKITPEEYSSRIKNIILFLTSQYEELIQGLSKKMKEAAARKDFEAAAEMRDQLNALGSIGEGRNHSVSFNELEDLKNLLKLDKLPERIEAFDISNISGKLATGSMVSFYKGAPDKNNYRRFRIKTVPMMDDYKCLSEVVRRRYARLIAEKSRLPDLILIDGGRSHLLTADKELKKLSLQINIAAIAKPPREIRDNRKDNIYIRGRIKPIRLKSDTPALNLVRKIRDEAHRFAVKYHRLLRRKKIIGK
ncbi:MAG: excinuclease ABC subunit UvrC [Candidatus Omnitrophica bacterium]|nr:excinuclease ABC subunit UvrC [Candidatus Omnitrophota bacterium]